MFDVTKMFDPALTSYKPPKSSAYASWGDPGAISLSGGYPDPEYYPWELIGKLATEALAKDYPRILAYGPSNGFAELREWVAEHSKQNGVEAKADEVVLCDGSTETMSLVARLVLQPGDAMVMEAPSYSGAVSVFLTSVAHVEQIPMDEQGIDIAKLEAYAKERKASGRPLKLVYIMPNYHNPLGTSTTVERRKELVAMAQKYDFLILEDDAYIEFRYEGERLPSIKAFDTDGHVIYTSTFSKPLAPGLRLAWIVASPVVAGALSRLKGSSNMSANHLGQAIALAYCKEGHIYKHIEKMNALYKMKKDLMLKTLEEHMPDFVTWTKPSGGFFLWLEIEEGRVDGIELLKETKGKVTYRPGDSFYATEEGLNKLRLCFTFEPAEKVEKGVILLAEAIKKLAK
jgi:2-aminoadipate transaminase